MAWNPAHFDVKRLSITLPKNNLHIQVGKPNLIQVYPTHLELFCPRPGQENEFQQMLPEPNYIRGLLDVNS